MAIAIDTSTPAVTDVAGTVATSVTSNSFSPPANSLIVVGFGGASNSAASDIVTGVSDNLGAHLTWTEFTFCIVGTSSYCSLWRAFTTSSQTNMTVIVSLGANTLGQGGFLMPIVLSGCVSNQTATPVTNSSGTTALFSIAVTGTANGSQVFAVQTNFGPATSPTPASGQTNTFNGNNSFVTESGNGYWMQSTTSPSSGGTITINDTAPSGSNSSSVAVEILAAVGGGATLSVAEIN